jgi:hypothetical protein
MAHRTVGGKPLIHQPALADVARDDHPVVVIQKSVQVDASEVLVNLALWAADTRYAGQGNVLFLMPTQNQMDDFAQARIDRALQESPYLRERLQPEPPRRKGADSKRLKRLGDGAVYLRGADSKRQIASVDADLVILDEFDQMEEGVIELARRRLASSVDTAAAPAASKPALLRKDACTLRKRARTVSCPLGKVGTSELPSWCGIWHPAPGEPPPPVRRGGATKLVFGTACWIAHPPAGRPGILLSVDVGGLVYQGISSGCASWEPKLCLGRPPGTKIRADLSAP